MGSRESIGRLMDTPMNRRQFLGFLGASSLVILGISGIIKGISSVANRQVGNGYGDTAYGGEPSQRRTSRRL